MYIDYNDSTVKALLPLHGLEIEQFRQILAVLTKANQTYFHLTQNHNYFYKMLRLNEEEFQDDPAFKKLPVKEKHEWQLIRNTKSGDRGYVNRYFISALKSVQSELYTEIIEPQLINPSPTDFFQLELSAEIDTLLLFYGIPPYLECLVQVSQFRESVFSKKRRQYVSFIESRMLYALSEFLKAYENDLPLLKKTLLDPSHQEQWAVRNEARLKEIFNQLCQRANPNHHNPLSRETINCLRSIYVSFFNIAMELLQAGISISPGFRELLPVIPDQLDFTKNGLEYDQAWNRYQQHQFLFMRLPKEKKERLETCLHSLSPAQRVMWMGCLGKIEIQTLILPMIRTPHRFESLARSAYEIKRVDPEYPFALRVQKVIKEVYWKYEEKLSASEELQKLFKAQTQKKTTQSTSTTEIQEKSGPLHAVTEEEKKAIQMLKEKSFLVVDDSDRIRKMTVDVLKHAGVQQVWEAGEGKTGWQLLNQHKVDVVLCDWIMPEMNGMELLQKIMHSHELMLRTAFLMLTTVDDKHSVVQAISHGARGYLIKPFDRQHLFEQIFKALKWIEQEQKHVEKLFKSNVITQVAKPFF